MTLQHPSASHAESDEFPRGTLRLGQVLMAFGAIGLGLLMACRLMLPQDSARHAGQFAIFVLSAWPLLLGSAMTEMVGVPGKSRTVARALLALACCYLLVRTLLSTLH